MKYRTFFRNIELFFFAFPPVRGLPADLFPANFRVAPASFSCEGEVTIATGGVATGDAAAGRRLVPHRLLRRATNGEVVCVVVHHRALDRWQRGTTTRSGAGPLTSVSLLDGREGRDGI